MAEKKVVKVLIAGKVMTMSGYESEEYMQKVAAYINSKIEEYEKTDAFRHASSDIRHRMLELNFADSYFKEKEHVEDLELRLKEKVNELDEMKHNYVNSQVMVEDQKKDISTLEAKLREAETSITRLQTTLKERDKVLADLQSAAKEQNAARIQTFNAKQPEAAESKQPEQPAGAAVAKAPEPQFTQQSLEDLLPPNEAAQPQPAAPSPTIVVSPAETPVRQQTEAATVQTSSVQTAATSPREEEESSGRGRETVPVDTRPSGDAFRSNRNGKRRR